MNKLGKYTVTTLGDTYRNFIVLAVLVVSVCTATGSYAQSDDGNVKSVAALEQFIQSLDRFEATFEQTLYGENGDALKISTGTIRLKRPARFVWTYDAPESQLIVADGESLWLYDQDLEQVTVNAIGDRITGTPLELLMGAAPLAEGFAIESLGMSDGIDWFGLEPLTQSSDFERVFIGLQGDALAAMELRDSFGQATQIVLGDFDRNVSLDDSLFEFEVPAGVDVIGLDE